MTKTFEWVTSTGAQGKIVATYEEVMECKTLNADGYILKGNAEPTSAGKREMIAYIDGKKIDSCWNTAFWRLIDTGKAGVKKIWGMKIGFNAEDAERYEKFVAKLIEEGATEEVKAYCAEKKEKARKAEIKEAKETIAEAEKQRDIPTAREAEIRRKEYNDLYNEGGDGYVPEWITTEEYEQAKAIIATT